MEDIIEAYNLVLSGSDYAEPLHYENIIVVFSGGRVYFYSHDGKMPYGNKPLPRTEDLFISMLDNVNEYISNLEDLGKYICFKCKSEEDLPVAKFIDKAPHCSKCSGKEVSKQEVQQETLQEAKQDIKHKKTDKITGEVKEMNIKEAINLLKSNGYIIKKSVEKYKIIYFLDSSPTNPKISEKYYSSVENFIEEAGNGFLNPCLAKHLKKQDLEEV